MIKEKNNSLIIYSVFITYPWPSALRDRSNEIPQHTWFADIILMIMITPKLLSNVSYQGVCLNHIHSGMLYLLEASYKHYFMCLYESCKMYLASKAKYDRSQKLI